jgi:transposase
MRTIPKKFLTEAELTQLTKQHRSEKNRRTADRIKAVVWFHLGFSYKKIADLLFIYEETAALHVAEYYNDRKLTFITGGSESKLTEEQTEELAEHLDTCTYTKVADICEYVQKNIVFSTPFKA